MDVVCSGAVAVLSKSIICRVDHTLHVDLGTMDKAYIMCMYASVCL